MENYAEFRNEVKPVADSCGITEEELKALFDILYEIHYHDNFIIRTQR